MLRLGTRVRLKGREGLVIARTLSGEPSYDVRLPDGTIQRYVPEGELEALPQRPAAGQEG